MTPSCLILLFILFFLAFYPKVVGPLLLAALPVLVLVSYLPGRRLRKRVEDKSQELRELPYEDLQEMEGEPPEYGDIEVTVEADTPDEAVLDLNGSDWLRVLVRGSEEVLFYDLVRVDGFYRSRDGRLQPMSDAELDAYD